MRRITCSTVLLNPHSFNHQNLKPNHHCKLGDMTFNLYLPYIETANYRHAPKNCLSPKKKKGKKWKRLIMRRSSISLSSEKIKKAKK
jgi:hypothetical protein